MKISDCCGTPAGDFEDVGICPDCREHCEWEEIDEDEEDFQPCDECDLPDACDDFGCAIKNGIKSPNTF